ncbi:His Kinase A domain containing protein, partial [Dissophora globulifera]
SSIPRPRSIQRRKSEGTSLQMSRLEQQADSALGGPSSSRSPVTAATRSFSRSGKSSGVETKGVDQRKNSDARIRRISDSGLSSSSKLSGSALAERLSGFAQTVRGLSRSSFSPGHSSPVMTPSTNSTYSTPSSSESSPHQCLVNPGNTSVADMDYHPAAHTQTIESWNDDLIHTRQDQRTSHFSRSRPSAEAGFSHISSPDEFPFFTTTVPNPPNEEKRLRALHGYQILETGVDPNFDHIVQLVATVMGARLCVVSLVDQQTVTYKAQFPSPSPSCARQQSLCGLTILRAPNDPLIILDTKADKRFQAFPIVAGSPGIRFYAGAPLTTSDGFNLGALCLMDFEPRASFSERERSLLIDFASVVMREMELWNDQVQLCIRNRMMRDVTRWVRGCLEIPLLEQSLKDNAYTHSFRPPEPSPLILDSSYQHPLPIPSDLSTSSSRTLTALTEVDTSHGSTTVTPAPTTSTPLPAMVPVPRPESATNYLQEKAIPEACIVIQATLNVDAVYLVQATTNQTPILQSGSPVVWNYLDVAGRGKGSVGIVRGAQVVGDATHTSLACLASSRKSSRTFTRPVFDEENQYAKRQKSAWVCTDEGCRPHRLGDALLNAKEPVWERDLPIIKEMLGYVRQEIPTPALTPGQNSLYTCFQGQDMIEKERFAAAGGGPKSYKEHHQRLLCHTFQGTLPLLAAGSTTPYQSCLVVPVLGPSSSHGTQTDDEPWAYFVILSATRTKQFSFHERIYLKNFGSCIVTEVMKRRVEAADKAKGTFIKSISHELRTPLHIILGILELLYASPEEPLSDAQLAMVTSAEVSGKKLMDTINNIIDLANIDPDNDMGAREMNSDRSSTPLPELEETAIEEVDIRDLCQKVAESMSNACTDKNVVLVPSWTKPSLSSPPSSSNNSASCSMTNVSLSNEVNTYLPADVFNGFIPHNLYPIRRTVLELIVAMDEPEQTPDQDPQWNFSMDLVENAIKFTTSGFVEFSAVALTSSPIPMKPPHPDARPILFTVRDTGRGISAEFLQSHLFKRFTQEDPLQVGTGLGMALVKELVKKLGGWMEVWSEGIEGKGCVVKVMIWAMPAVRQNKSLKDIPGPWQDASCRFYAGEPCVGANRLFKIMGERMMGQQLNMNVERGDEHDVTIEEMLKDLPDQSRCDLLVINDDVPRLKAYLSYWTQYHQKVRDEGIESPRTPTPLLMLTAPPNSKYIQNLVDDYFKREIDINATERPASIVLLSKPIGPIKLVQCLRECFTPAFSNRCLDTPQGSPQLSPSKSPSMMNPSSMSLLRSPTVPHITTATLGVQDDRVWSAGTIIKQSLTSPLMQGADYDHSQPMVGIPSFTSEGELILPPVVVVPSGPNPVTMRENESEPVMATLHHLQYYNDRTNTEDQTEVPNTRPMTPPSLITTAPDLETPGTTTQSERTPSRMSRSEASDADTSQASVEESPSKVKSRRSIRNYKHKKKPTVAGSPSVKAVELGGTLPSLAGESPLGASATTTSIKPSLSATAAVAAATATQEHGQVKSVDKALPRVLIVEDNITNRMILRTFLKKRGISVVEAENGKIGVERFEEEVRRREGKCGFEFVLMDLQMPVMDGNMATKKIREFEHMIAKHHEMAALAAADARSPDGKGDEFESCYRRTVIFALTGLAADEDKRLAFECGVDGYMSLKALGSLMLSCMPADMEGSSGP